jgi:hypothetical protein
MIASYQPTYGQPGRLACPFEPRLQIFNQVPNRALGALIGFSGEQRPASGKATLHALNVGIAHMGPVQLPHHGFSVVVS